MAWREYHESTKHSVESLRRSPHVLDWANMPDPFRHYEGVPVVDLPSDPPMLEIPALAVLQGRSGATLGADGAGFLSQLLFYSAAISASKVVISAGYRYALRVNPSSGNLHPTEFHFIARDLQGWPDGLYHYRPSSHTAEQRAAGRFEMNPTGEAPVVFVLTTIAWREAWKYRERAYRYCLHDMGHAWQALALAARAMGCETFATGHFPDDDMARFCRLNQDEWPMLIVALRGRRIPVLQPESDRERVQGPVWFTGQPNRLSDETVPYPRIESIHSATKLDGNHKGIHEAGSPRGGSGDIKLPAPASSTRSFGEVVRSRRSALDFLGGTPSMSFLQLSAILASAVQPLSADFASTCFIQLYLYVHRVEGLKPGIYRHWRERAELEKIKSGDQRVVAAGLSLRQDLAGNSCVTFSMIADLDRAACAHDDRAYRYAHFEAGAIGHRLYLAAEAFGLGATGIGAFFDNEVHRYLGLASNEGQVVYHFAIGHPVFDPRVEA